MKMKREIIEFRDAELTVDSGNDTGQWVGGVAARFNVPYILYTDDAGLTYSEQLDAGCCDGVDLSTTVMRYNHDDSYPVLARTSNNTMQISIDTNQIYVKADIAPTSAGKDIYALIKRGDISGQSIGMVVADDYFDRATRTRHITKITKFVDISAVDRPAYGDSTSLEALKRSLEAADQERADVRKRIYIMTML